MLNIVTLGPFSVTTDSGHLAAPSAPKPRQMLALLAVNAGHVVRIPMIVDELWGGQPPPSAVGVLQSYVMQTRKAIRTAAARPAERAADLIVTRLGGYLLDVPRASLDFFWFEQSVDQGGRALAAGEAASAAALLHNALSQWRGPPLADVQKGPVLELDCLRMERLRLHGLRLRIEVDMRMGRHRELIGELRKLTAQHPWDEKLHGQLMIALYSSGRRMHALSVYRNLRHACHIEFGGEPSSRLRELHSGILVALCRAELLSILHGA